MPNLGALPRRAARRAERLKCGDPPGARDDEHEPLARVDADARLRPLRQVIGLVAARFVWIQPGTCPVEPGSLLVSPPGKPNGPPNGPVSGFPAPESRRRRMKVPRSFLGLGGRD